MSRSHPCVRSSQLPYPEIRPRHDLRSWARSWRTGYPSGSMARRVHGEVLSRILARYGGVDTVGLAI